MTRLLTLLALLVLPACAAERWKLQYFYDTDEFRMTIVDFRFASPQRGMAVGYLMDTDGRQQKPFGLVTSDGGNTWSPISLPALPRRLFFLNESLGWLVAGNRLYRTTEFGREWKSLGGLQGVLELCFLDDKRGFAAGSNKTVYETSDGGDHWKKLEVTNEHKTNRSTSFYSVISFATPTEGMIFGYTQPPTHDAFSRHPEWMQPESRRREVPRVLLSLETRDAGTHWIASQVSAFGRMKRVRMTPGGASLALMEYRDRFSWPSEVHAFNWKTGKTGSHFHPTDRVITDIAWPEGGRGYLAAIETPGEIARTPIPGKLKIMQSLNGEAWTEMAVDYRAEGQAAFLAAPDASHIWVATSTGMILKLVSE